ncbi:MAG: 2-oxoacid:acceptor oxidoreductase family protein [Candidatus Ancaeobacter aquaticus]|nr:2-oxoacid:acceptor oxidoreductase family protein [Candidatus Ancaeobacter aquaticus]
MIRKIIISGSGGQGILLAGKVLADAAIKEGKEVTYMPSYGAEVRGGTANVNVIISDEEIASPVVLVPDTVLVFNAPSKDKFEGLVKTGGLMVVNDSIVTKKEKRTDIDYLFISATDIAQTHGSIKSANMVMLGAYSGKTNVISIKSLIASFNEMFGHKKEELRKINEIAIREGWTRGNG